MSLSFHILKIPSTAPPHKKIVNDFCSNMSFITRGQFIATITRSLIHFGRLIATLIAGAAVLCACHDKGASAVEARRVVAVAVRADQRTPVVTLPGEVQARYSSPLSFRIGGKIVERLVHLGSTVEAGQVIARLDPGEARKNAISAISQAQAAQQRLTYANKHLERDRAQAQENLIAPAQLEETEASYASAVAQRDQTAQQAALAEDQLSHTMLAADRAGVVTAELADTGQNVVAGQPVYRVAVSGDVDAVCDVTESTIASLSIGQAATLKFAALPGRTFVARIRELAPAADPQSRTYRVKLSIDHPGVDVRLGMTAEIALALDNASRQDRRMSFTLPATALFHDGTAPALWVIHQPDDVLQLRRVSVGRYDARTITVTSGLSDGERIVLQGVNTVSAAEKVHPVAPLHPEDFAP